MAGYMTADLVGGFQKAQKEAQMEELKTNLGKLYSSGLPQDKIMEQAIPMIAKVDPTAAINMGQQVQAQKQTMLQNKLKFAEYDIERVLADPNSTQDQINATTTKYTTDPELSSFFPKGFSLTKKSDGGIQATMQFGHLNAEQQATIQKQAGGTKISPETMVAAVMKDGKIVGAPTLLEQAPMSEREKADLKLKQDAAKGGQGALTPDGAELSAQLAIQGIDLKLPSMGMGNKAAGARVQVINKIAADMKEKGLGAESIALYTANLKGNSATLTKLKQQEGVVLAFEKTAAANLKVLEGTIDKLPDTGVPIANIIRRSIGLDVSGSTDITKFNTAEQTAINETARVLNSANGAGVISDTARKEVSDLLKGKSATKKQIRAAVAILEQDMANRKVGFEKQIKETQEKILNPTLDNPGAVEKPQTTEPVVPVEVQNKLKKEGDTTEYFGYIYRRVGTKIQRKQKGT